MKLKSLALLALLAIVVVSCRKKPDPVVVSNSDTISKGGDTTITPIDSVSQLSISIDNVAGNQLLSLGSTQYLNENGDTFSVDAYKYYISNVSVYTDAGEEYKEVESYHLVDEDVQKSKSFTLSGLPAGNYVKIKFLLGVDSLHNVSGAQKGDLDPLKAMYWDWNTGYIMAKIEGRSPQSKSKLIGFHIGGYKDIYSALNWVTLTLPTNAVVAKTKKATIHLKADITEWFKTPTTIKFAELSSITTVNDKSAIMAENYADMFSVDHVENK